MSATAVPAASPPPTSVPSAPGPAPFAAVPQAPINVPVQATMQPDTPFTSVQATTVSDDRLATARANMMTAARNMDRADAAAASGATVPAPAAAPAAELPAVVKPGETAPAAKSAEAEKPKDPPAPTVTARISDLTKRNREVVAEARAAGERAAAAEARAVAAEARATEAAAAHAALQAAPDKFEAIKKLFKDDPLAAIDQVGDNWKDLVIRVASGGIPPSPEEVAAAEKERAEVERDTRLKTLEDQIKADKEAATARAKAEENKTREAERTRVEAENTTAAIAFVSKSLIKPETHPYLVNIAEDAAAEAIAQVDIAVAEAFRHKQRATASITSPEESVKLTRLALDGLNSYYQDLAQRIAPPKAPEQTGAAPVSAAPAATVAAAALPVVAESQQRRPVGTITHAVAGESPLAAQPQRLTPEEARVRAMDAARRLPPL